MSAICCGRPAAALPVFACWISSPVPAGSLSAFGRSAAWCMESIRIPTPWRPTPRTLARPSRSTCATALRCPRPTSCWPVPPCQPWSRAGSRRGAEDARDGLPVVLRVIRDLQPRVAVIENVPELARRGRHVLDGVRAELHSLGYATSEYLLDSSRYDVPQRRMRLFTVAAVEGLPLPAFPPPGTAAVSVLEALGPGCLDDAPGARLLTPEMDAYVARYERASGCRRPRDLHLDAPARTVTASNIARATGDMLRLRLPDGRRRMLTLREAARLQGFPDWFAFAGSHASQAKQIGNAVPPLVARALAATVLEALAVPAASLSRAA